ncbi:hypothetical protein NCAS_0E01330 [Naumovozyma castellii]|uniref:Sodium/calcium exchanger membrane region domain-containing protein n=1 Tax=Naumovozyma castellii TaxID=27288 RepID=G0VFD7_NAUCA|nr:hypothetical protein NCAS_0E01330 [Naumovozyma castellii CBS 4309]CCC70203.1 hypothetical protein NCAS_0E01330 [Naumovozyma castellii CBS 4309]
MSKDQDHVRRVFSVDDDPKEVESDIRYLEGLHDGLKYALQEGNKSISAQPQQQQSLRSPSVPNEDNIKSSSAPDLLSASTGSIQTQNLYLNPTRSKNSETITNLNNKNLNKKKHRIISQSIVNGPKSISRLTTLNSPELFVSKSNHTITSISKKKNNKNINNDSFFDDHDKFIIHDPPRPGLGHDLLIEELNDQDDDDVYGDNDNDNNFRHPDDLENNAIDDQLSLASSLESYTLRERQDAINKTHPFGIRIWKPALYKKMRSVQRAADEDIHETKWKTITWPVHLTNIIWSLTVGLLLFILFSLAGVMVCILGLFTGSAREYSVICFKLAKYLIWPFGKVVYLTVDKKYLEEDNAEGISVPQFYKWVTSYSNRLFFHQNPNEQDCNTSLTAHESLNQPSYGSIQHFITKQQQERQNKLQNPFITPHDDRPRSSSPNTPVVYNSKNNTINNANEEPTMAQDNSTQRRLFGRGKWTWGRLIFYLCFHLILEPIVFVVTLISWLFVFTIPMSNILWNLMYHCRKHPLALGFKNIRNTREAPSTANYDEDRDSNRNILLCTFRCAGWHYYKYTVDGTNIIVVNLIAMVFFTIFNFYFIKNVWHFNFWFTDESAIFMLCLLSIIPLAFYIGQAVASISAQTSMGVGAVINAFFSTVVEVFLYCVALKQSKGPLVEGSMIGSILGAVLLLPGLSMCGGAWNRKTQRYNPASAGVSSAMLIFSMLVMFVPTMLYELYGGYTVDCDDGAEQALTFSIFILAVSSTHCSFKHPPLQFNRMYTHVIQPMSVSCAIVLFMAYAIGLWFTLRTHAKMIWQLPITDQQPKENSNITQGLNSEQNSVLLQRRSQTQLNQDAGGHDAPNWSRKKSTCILLIATLLYAIIAEILIACVDSVLEDFPSLNPKFLGLTIFALVPNTTEFLNAISFAIHGNVALSMEIGSAYALQVCLLQIPALVLYSIFYTWNMDHSLIDIRKQMFPLIFPRWDAIASIASIFMFTYLYAEGKSNYFKGSMLILLYVVVILGFYFQDILTNWQW